MIETNCIFIDDWIRGMRNPQIKGVVDVDADQQMGGL